VTTRSSIAECVAADGHLSRRLGECDANAAECFGRIMDHELGRNAEHAISGALERAIATRICTLAMGMGAAIDFDHETACRHEEIGDQTRDVVAGMYDEAKKEVATLRLTVTPPGAEVFVDGTSRGKAENLLDPVFVSPGEHVIEARADGYRPAREAITAARGTERDLALTLVREQSASAGPGLVDGGVGGTSGQGPGGHDPPQNGSSDRTILPAVLVGGGITLIAAGIGVGFLVASNGTRSDAEDLAQDLDALGGCATGTPNADRCATLRDRYETADTQRNISTVGFIGAGVAAVGTVAYVLLTAPGQSSATKPRAAEPVGSLSRDGFAIGLRGAF
jgi:hypothetical protein